VTRERVFMALDESKRGGVYSLLLALRGGSPCSCGPMDSATTGFSGPLFYASRSWSLTASYSTGPQIRNRWRAVAPEDPMHFPRLPDGAGTGTMHDHCIDINAIRQFSGPPSAWSWLMCDSWVRGAWRPEWRNTWVISRYLNTVCPVP
jgi:hypothetical protein